MKSEIKVGIITIVASILFLMSFFYLKEIKFQDMYYVIAEFQNIKGLEEGQKAYLHGVNIGTVKKIKVSNDKVYVTLEIDKKFQLPVEPKFIVDTMGLMGERYVGIIKPDSYYLKIIQKNSNLYANFKKGEKIRITGFENNGKKAGLINIFGKISQIDKNGAIIEVESYIPRIKNSSISFSALDNNRSEFSGNIVVPSAFLVLKSHDKAGFIQGKISKLDYYNKSIECEVIRPVISETNGYDFFGKQLMEKTNYLIVIKHKYGDFIDKKKLLAILDGKKVEVFGDFYIGDKLPSTSDLLSEGMDLIGILKGTIGKVDILLEDSVVLVREMRRFTDQEIINKLHEGLANIITTTESFKSAAGNFNIASNNVKKSSYDFKSITSKGKKQTADILNMIQKFVGNTDKKVKTQLDKTGKILENVDIFSLDLKNLITKNKKAFTHTMENLELGTEYIKDLFGSVYDKGVTTKYIRDMFKNFSLSGVKLNQVLDEVKDFFDISDSKGKKSSRKVSGTFRKAKKAVETIVDTTGSLHCRVFHQNDSKQYYTDAFVKVFPGGQNKFFQIGANDIGQSAKLDLEVGHEANRYRLSGGIIDSRPGFGIDYKFGIFETGFDLIGVEDSMVKVHGAIVFSKNIGVLLEIDDALDSSRIYNVGFEKRF